MINCSRGTYLNSSKRRSTYTTFFQACRFDPLNKIQASIFYDLAISKRQQKMKKRIVPLSPRTVAIKVMLSLILEWDVECILPADKNRYKMIDNG